MEKVIIWHNPKCSKSNQAKNILESKELDIEYFEYLNENITPSQIKQVMKMLEIDDIRSMLRSKEDEYKTLNINNKELSQDDIIELVIKTPKLIERPIVIKDNKAIIARPMENIQKLF
jgi:arsenate reductase